MQKIRFVPQLFFEILVRYCKLYILGTWDMPGHAYKKEQYQLLGNFDVYLHVKKKSTWSLTSFLWYYTLKNPAIWLAEIILAHNLRIKILPDKGFAVKYKSQYDFYLKYFQEKLMLQFFKKYQKDQFLTHFVHVKAK